MDRRRQPSPSVDSNPPSAEEASPYVDVDEVAALLRMKPKSIYELSSRGRLDRCKRKVGGRVLFHRAILLRMVEDGELSN